MVVIYHTSVIFRVPTYWGSTPFGDVPRFLDSGVDFFFVLSGFIILNAHSGDIGAPTCLANFIWRRFVRIYPLYWAVFCAVLVPLLMTKSNIGFERIVREFFLLPTSGMVTDPKIVVVSWTLCFEIAFYAVFGLAIYNRTLGIVIGSLWGLAAIYSLGELNPFRWTILSSPYPFLFLIGMLVQRVWSSGKFGLPLLPTFLLGVFVFAVAAVNRVNLLGLPPALMQWLYGAGAGLIILAAVETERQGKLGFPQWLTRLGDASYSLYLVHFTILSMLAKLIVATGFLKGLPLQVIFFAMVVATVAVGLAMHAFVEKPLLKWCTGSRKPMRTENPPVMDREYNRENVKGQLSSSE